MRGGQISMSKIIKVYFTKTATTDFCNQYLEMLREIFPEDKIIGIPASVVSDVIITEEKGDDYPF